MKLRVRPIHGWGWFKGAEPMEVPPPFELTATVTQPGEPFTSVLGEVPAGEHPLAGYWLVLAPRHTPFGTPFDGHCNLFGFDHAVAVPRISEAFPETPILTGSVQIDEIQD